MTNEELKKYYEELFAKIDIRTMLRDYFIDRELDSYFDRIEPLNVIPKNENALRVVPKTLP